MAIKVLKPEIIEQIAAGEVVENPASVIKELVENSLDAGATIIEINLLESGLKEIRIADNGSGINPCETELAFQRHATSKINSAEDLYSIKSLGFRGEALASIGAVSKIKLITRTAEEIIGTEINIAGGLIKDTDNKGAPQGTEITVKDLFYNTPARRAFLKSPTQEMKKISQLVTGLSFSFPMVAFYLYHNEKLLFKTKGDGNILDIIEEAYGRETAKNMVELQKTEQGPVSIYGYISKPIFTRSTRKYQTLLINNRLVQNNMISYTLKRGYKGLIQGNKFPLSVIYIEVPPETVDVNIHPSKAEVRFHNENEIAGLVYKSVSISLGRSPTPVYSRKVTTGESMNKEEPALNPIQNNKCHTTYKIRSETTDYEPFREKEISSEKVLETFQGVHKPDNLFPDEEYRIIGQFLSSYIVAQKSGELILIDQHAAHERILYEKFLKKYHERKKESFMLTSPLTVEIPFNWREGIQTVTQYLEDNGFVIESFGDNTLIVREIPAFLSPYFNLDYFMDLLEKLVEEKEESLDKKDLIIRTASCKAAVKANKYLSQEEMSALINDWQKTDIPNYCPHGRPAVISFSIDDLEKSFKRKGGS